MPAVSLSRIGAMVVVCVTSGCVSISALQTARPMAQGEFSAQGAIGYESLVFTRQGSTSEERDAEDQIERIKVPIVEAGLRYGLMHDVDVGFRYTLPGTMAVDGKYLLWENGPLAMAVGAGFGYGTFDFGGGSSSSDGDNNNDDEDDGTTDTSTDSSDSGKTVFKITDLFVPFYISYDLTFLSSVYAVPRLLSRKIVVEDDTGEEDRTGLVVGSSFGIMVDWFVFEAGFFTAPGSQGEGGTTQVMLGFVSGIEKRQAPASKGGDGSRRRQRR